MSDSMAAPNNRANGIGLSIHNKRLQISLPCLITIGDAKTTAGRRGVKIRGALQAVFVAMRANSNISTRTAKCSRRARAHVRAATTCAPGSSMPP